jgi:Mg-chelatase subunit ChlD
VVTFDVEVQQLTPLDELEGKLAPDPTEDKLMRSVLEGDKQKIDDGRLVADAVNRGINSFTPDLLFSNLIQNMRVAKQLYGDRIIRLVAGHDTDYIEKNLNIPEFRKQVLQNIKQRIEGLKQSGLVAADGTISERGLNFSAITTYLDDLDHIEPKGTLGERRHKERSHHGEHTETRAYRRGDHFHDIAVRATIRQAVRRGRRVLRAQDLRISERRSKGMINLIYGLDASASMKGDKLAVAKKAGIALAHKAIQRKDNAGIIVFGRDVTEAVAPTQDFAHLLDRIVRIKASRETDFTKLVMRAIELFGDVLGTKHLIIITDALPTVGKEPEAETLRAISAARAADVTTSLIGINLDTNGILFGREMATLGDGRFSLATNLADVDRIVLQDYEDIAARL